MSVQKSVLVSGSPHNLFMVIHSCYLSPFRRYCLQIVFDMKLLYFNLYPVSIWKCCSCYSTLPPTFATTIVLWFLLTSHGKFYSVAANVLLPCHIRKTFSSTNMFFPSMSPSSLLRRIPCSYRTSTCTVALSSCINLKWFMYIGAEVCLHLSSTLLNLMARTLLFNCILPIAGQIRYFHSLESAPDKLKKGNRFCWNSPSYDPYGSLILFAENPDQNNAYCYTRPI